MEDEFYHLTVKGNDLKTHVRRFQELATLCPTMVSDSEKMIKAFIGGLPQSINENVTASKPQTLEEAINIALRLMDQDRASLVKVPVANFTLQSSVQLLQENTDSVRSNQRISPTAPSEPLKLKAFAMLAAYASRAVVILPATSCWKAA
nr:reverse transcriptase domain-containing protein [Tanacetum cinerariifolium]